MNVGIDKAVQEEAAMRDKTWDCDGKFGVIQFIKPTHCDSQVCYNTNDNKVAVNV